jgi:hypothetical protein
MKPLKKKLNEKLIKKVLAHIRGDFRRYDQDLVAVFKGNDIGSVKDPEFAACETKACFGGWAFLLGRPRKTWKRFMYDDSNILGRAEKLLGLYEEEATLLFDMTGKTSPKTDLRIIQQRLQDIRRSRKIENARRRGVSKEQLEKMADKLMYNCSYDTEK